MIYQIEVKEEIKHCTKCPFLMSDDGCNLQTNEQNADHETFESQFAECPLKKVEG
jgi:recombinational DNA repair protein RecR